MFKKFSKKLRERGIYIIVSWISGGLLKHNIIKSTQSLPSFYISQTVRQLQVKIPVILSNMLQIFVWEVLYDL